MTSSSTITNTDISNSPQPLPLGYPYAERKRRFALDMAEHNAVEQMPASKRAAFERQVYIIKVPLEGEEKDEDDTDATSTTNIVQYNCVKHDNVKCTTCQKTALERYQDTLYSNYGLLHTLYAYREFFFQLFIIYRQRREEKKMSSELRGKLKGLLKAYSIGYRARPISLRDPMENDMTNKYVTVNAWICPAVSRALYRAHVLNIGGRQYRESSVDNKFFHDVVLPTLIYLHESLARRAREKKEKKRNASLKLDLIQDESCEGFDNANNARDIFVHFLAVSGVSGAESDIADFAVQQRMAMIQRTETYKEGAYLFAELPSETMSAIAKVQFDYNDGLISLDDTEQGFCAALAANGRSGVDYLLPGQNLYKPKPGDQMKFDFGERRMKYTCAPVSNVKE